jgi:hypothetical protein
MMMKRKKRSKEKALEGRGGGLTKMMEKGGKGNKICHADIVYYTNEKNAALYQRE